MKYISSSSRNSASNKKTQKNGIAISNTISARHPELTSADFLTPLFIYILVLEINNNWILKVWYLFIQNSYSHDDTLDLLIFCL